jgi:hypothetical protein
MRVCELHRERAVETLISRQDGVEYDLCAECKKMLESILYGDSTEEVTPIGPRRRRTRKIVDGAET